MLSGVVSLHKRTVCNTAEGLCGSVCPTSASLHVSAASFIPPDIRASFLWAQEQLAAPVGHSHNEKKPTIFPSGSTHTHGKTHTLPARANTFPVVQLCSNSRTGLLVQMH